MRAPGLINTPITKLRAALELALGYNAVEFKGDFKSLDLEIEKLQKHLGAHGIAKPPQDALLSALRNFVRDRKFSNPEQARLTSFGYTEPFDALNFGLIGDEELFSLFISCIDQYRLNPRALRQCYHGLLHSYFLYDVETATTSCARENWSRLKDYLAERTPTLTPLGTQTSWVETLQGNIEIFGADPGDFYGSEIFHGRPERFDLIRIELPITEASWLVWKVIVGQVKAATESTDAKFSAALPELMTLLDNNPLAKNYGLASILTRYSACAIPMLHEPLRDFAVKTWGNPWLAINEAKWSGVSTEARLMIGNWLKLDLMQKFFDLLADDGKNDTRRLEFWKTYHHKIHEMHFALGERARNHTGKDFRKLRKQMEGLILILKGAGSPENNAFIMCIGKHVIVEFGKKGNACYIYHQNRLPFALKGEVHGNTTSLKHKSHVEWLNHADKSTSPWEEKFRQSLRDTVKVEIPISTPQARFQQSAGVSTNNGRTIIAPRAFKDIDGAIPPEPLDFYKSKTVEETNDTQPFTIDDVKEYCVENQCDYQDLRSKGGYLWIVKRDADEDVVAETLNSWGFTFKSPRGWWIQ